MARKTSTVLMMMFGTLVLLGVIGGLGFVLVSDYDAVEYEYDVTGTHEIAYGSGKASWNLYGTVSTTYMDLLGVTRITMTSDINYSDMTEELKKYDFAGRWSFLSEPDLGTVTDSILDYTTMDGELDVDVYEVTEGNEVIVRWVGQENGIIYRVERTITNDDLETNIIQVLVSYKDTKMPFKI